MRRLGGIQVILNSFKIWIDKSICWIKRLIDIDFGSYLLALFKSIIFSDWDEKVFPWSKQLILSIEGVETKFFVSSSRSFKEKSLNSLNRFLGVSKLGLQVEVLLLGKKILLMVLNKKSLLQWRQFKWLALCYYCWNCFISKTHK